MQCQADWFDVYGSRALDHFGRITEAKVLTKDNAWTKRYDWRSREDGGYQHYLYNHLTDDCRGFGNRLKDIRPFLHYFDLDKKGYRYATNWEIL